MKNIIEQMSEGFHTMHTTMSKIDYEMANTMWIPAHDLFTTMEDLLEDKIVITLNRIIRDQIIKMKENGKHKK